MSGKSIEEVCAFQWLSANEHALNAFSEMPSEKYLHVRYEDLLADRFNGIQSLCDFCEIEFSKEIKDMIDKDPKVSVVSLPSKDKWLKNKERIENILGTVEDMQKRLGYLEVSPISY